MMISRYLVFTLAIVIASICPSRAFALKDNTFSGGLFLGDSYAPNNFRLSIKNFDIGFSDVSEVYLGSRAWLENYYAGFGLASKPGFYGMVGYEWRFVPWIGMSFEFDGTMGIKGDAAGRVYIGIVAGW